MLSRVVDDEPLANFVLEENKFKPDGVHWRAFRPGSDGERSVFRVQDLCDEYIAATGQAFVGNLRDKQILGWARLSASAVRAGTPLLARPDVPPPRHAVIVGWPSEKERQKALAMLLASRATARRWP